MDRFTRYAFNPIISPRPDLPWAAKAVYGPAAIYLDGKVNIIYRAQDVEGTSVLGYAISSDGIHIDVSLDQPIYVPRMPFEQKTKEHWNSGCEDPRVTIINDRIFMIYTAYDGTNPPRVALTSIAIVDFLARNWNWETPKLITPPGVYDKDACVVKRVRGEGYVAFHRYGDAIWIDLLENLDFAGEKFLIGSVLAQPRKDNWDNIKIGIAAPPIETERGWILLYHCVSDPGFIYKVGAMLLDYDDPRKILARTNTPLLWPEKEYEINGQVPNVVFPCGAVVVEGIIYLYYGGGDTVIAVATMPISDLLNILN